MTESPSKPSAQIQDAPVERSWERDLLTQLAFASLKEQRRARRWNLFFKVSVLVYLSILLILYWPSDLSAPGTGKPHTALVDVRGLIAEEAESNADRIISGLRDAFEHEDTAGVVLRINSPGGSPVQAAYINEEIRYLRARYPDTPLYAVITDVCASGGYYVAVAADRIYAESSSIVGSIGVLINSFGFVGTMEKLGIERRLFTAGQYKGLLDPFSPIKEEEVQHLQGLLKDLHQHFIATVKQGRGERLNGGSELFSGLIWSGEKSVELGLVDAEGDIYEVARDVIGAEEIVDFTPKRSYIDRFAERVGVAIANMLHDQWSVADVSLR